MKTANKIFVGLALILVLTLTYKFTFTDSLNLDGTVLGEEDDLDASLDSLEQELEESLQELDEEIETETKTVEVEAEIENEDQVTAPTTENKYTTRTTTKTQNLFFVMPVEIETEVVSDNGVVVKENKTLLGKLLDLFSY
ncbi:hypothetical protein KA017_03950 [Candidatus Woesebacteria bacterium]|nr:hypothetical protein [Candidatus Woesebacteria bacterium]